MPSKHTKNHAEYLYMHEKKVKGRDFTWNRVQPDMEAPPCHWSKFLHLLQYPNHNINSPQGCNMQGPLWE